jgi:hypothetical protein
MAVTDISGPGSGANHFKAAGPTAAAIGIVASIIGISLIASAPNEPAPRLGTPGASAPAPGFSPVPGLPGIQSNENQPGAAGMQMGMEIVVKFKDDARVKDIIDSFWRDQASAKAKFETWKANRPEFAKLTLDRVTYSNELVLVHDGSAPAAERLTAMKSIVAKLGAVADISYAEPNMTAHPGGQ